MISFEEFAKKRKAKTVIVGSNALASYGLVSGYNMHCIQTDCKSLNGVSLDNVVFEYYRLWDNDNYLNKVGDNLYCPTPERAIIDCIVWQNENRDEGFLIEALQTYQQRGHHVEDLYECADHYLVPREVVNYWWQEALDEEDMSMG